MGNVNPNNVLIVDNNPTAFIHCRDHGIPIVPFNHADQADGELLELADYLRLLSASENMVAANKNYFRFHELAAHTDAVAAIKSLALSS